MQDDPPQDDDDAVLDNAPVYVSCSYKNLLKIPKTKKEVVERLLEFFSAFVTLYIGWRDLLALSMARPTIYLSLHVKTMPKE